MYNIIRFSLFRQIQERWKDYNGRRIIRCEIGTSCRLYLDLLNCKAICVLKITIHTGTNYQYLKPDEGIRYKDKEIIVFMFSCECTEKLISIIHRYLIIIELYKYAECNHVKKLSLHQTNKDKDDINFH